jgi:hypothetical protein
MLFLDGVYVESPDGCVRFCSKNYVLVIIIGDSSGLAMPHILMHSNSLCKVARSTVCKIRNLSLFSLHNTEVQYDRKMQILIAK